MKLSGESNIGKLIHTHMTGFLQLKLFLHGPSDGIALAQLQKKTFSPLDTYSIVLNH